MKDPGGIMYLTCQNITHWTVSKRCRNWEWQTARIWKIY